MSYDPNNIIARILRGEIPCNKAYEDETTLAFHDIRPQAPVHVLVVPKSAHVSFADFSINATPEEISGFFATVGKIARKLGVEESGYRLVANCGPDSRQEIPHFHVHILGKQVLGAIC